jgi:hypothetical protein
MPKKTINTLTDKNIWRSLQKYYYVAQSHIKSCVGNTTHTHTRVCVEGGI